MPRRGRSIGRKDSRCRTRKAAGQGVNKDDVDRHAKNRDAIVHRLQQLQNKNIASESEDSELNMTTWCKYGKSDGSKCYRCKHFYEIPKNLTRTPSVADRSCLVDSYADLCFVQAIVWIKTAVATMQYLPVREFQQVLRGQCKIGMDESNKYGENDAFSEISISDVSCASDTSPQRYRDACTKGQLIQKARVIPETEDEDSPEPDMFDSEFVMETNRGTFKVHGESSVARISTEGGSLSQKWPSTPGCSTGNISLTGKDNCTLEDQGGAECSMERFSITYNLDKIARQIPSPNLGDVTSKMITRDGIFSSRSGLESENVHVSLDSESDFVQSPDLFSDASIENCEPLRNGKERGRFDSSFGSMFYYSVQRQVNDIVSEGTDSTYGTLNIESVPNVYPSAEDTGVCKSKKNRSESVTRETCVNTNVIEDQRDVSKISNTRNRQDGSSRRLPAFTEAHDTASTRAKGTEFTKDICEFSDTNRESRIRRSAACKDNNDLKSSKHLYIRRKRRRSGERQVQRSENTNENERRDKAKLSAELVNFTLEALNVHSVALQAMKVILSTLEDETTVRTYVKRRRWRNSLEEEATKAILNLSEVYELEGWSGLYTSEIVKALICILTNNIRSSNLNQTSLDLHRTYILELCCSVEVCVKVIEFLTSMLVSFQPVLANVMTNCGEDMHSAINQVHLIFVALFITISKYRLMTRSPRSGKNDHVDVDNDDDDDDDDNVAIQSVTNLWKEEFTRGAFRYNRHNLHNKEKKWLNILESFAVACIEDFPRFANKSRQLYLTLSNGEFTR